MMEVVGILGVLLIFTNVFWARQCNKLVNKVMSGSYQVYQSATNPPPQRPSIQLPADPVEDLGVLEQFR